MDGEEIGEVTEVSPSCFKVEASMERDYWLGTDAIAESMRDAVRLRVMKEDIDTVRRDGPGHLGGHGVGQWSGFP